jgi:TorA maturation chaperone TorD
MLDIANDLRMLADLHATELTRERIQELQAIGFPAAQGFPQEIPDKLLDELATDFADIYLNGHFHASPQESVWTDEEELICQQPMFQVREWYSWHGLAVPNWRKMADDHLVNQLLFIAHLLDKAADDDPQIILRETARFMDEHLLRWLLPFAKRVTERCDTDFYASLALITAMQGDHIRDLLAEILDYPRPSFEEIEARMKAPQLAATQPQPMQYYPGVAASW